MTRRRRRKPPKASGRSLSSGDPDPEAVYTVNPEIVVAAFDDQVLLHHLNRGHTFSLNRTAGIVLELMDGEHSMAEILEILRQAYPESAEDITGDVLRTLRYLLEHDALDVSRKPTV